VLREYKISNNEMTRRKKAFTTLLVSLLIGLFLASKILNFPISIIIYLSITIILFCIDALFFRSFDFLLLTKIILSEKSLKRITRNESENFLIATIDKIKIKRTSKNSIREIYIRFRDGKNIAINGLVNFKQFQNDLKEIISKDVSIKEIREPIDFDHPLFYAILGLPISFVGVYLIKLMTNLDYLKVKIMLVGFSFFMLLEGIYFISAKPISKRYGDTRKFVDFIFGFTMISIGISVFILSFIC
jgi:hypothetical protein